MLCQCMHVVLAGLHRFGCELQAKIKTNGFVYSQTAVTVYSQAVLLVGMFTSVLGIQAHDLMNIQIRHTLYVVLTTMR